MGISVAVPIVSGGVSRIKYTTYTSKDPPAELPSFRQCLKKIKNQHLQGFRCLDGHGLVLLFILVFSFQLCQLLMDTGDAKLCERLQPSEMKFNQLHM